MQNDVSGLLAYSLKVCMSLMQNKKFRNEVLRVLVKLYMNLEKPDFINVCQVNIKYSKALVAYNCNYYYTDVWFLFKWSLDVWVFYHSF